MGVVAEEAFRVPKGLWCYRLDKKRVILGGSLTDGGSVFEWFRKTLALTCGATTGKVLREVQDMPPTCHGLVVRFHYKTRHTYCVGMISLREPIVFIRVKLATKYSPDSE